MTDAGVPISHEEAIRRWRAWTPEEVARRLAGVRCWAVVGGWAIDLFLGRTTREHEDIEISVPAAAFAEVAGALAGFEWDVAGDGCLWPYPAALGRFRQTWLRAPATQGPAGLRGRRAGARRGAACPAAALARSDRADVAMAR